MIHNYTEDGSGDSWSVAKSSTEGLVLVQVTEVFGQSDKYPGVVEMARIRLTREEALRMAKMLVECAGGDLQ